MKIYQKGLNPQGETIFVINKTSPRSWPGFEVINPHPDLTLIARRLFDLRQSQEIFVPAQTVPYFVEFAKGPISKVRFDSVKLTGGKGNQCHLNCCLEYQPGMQFYSGFTLIFVDRFTWQFHSWLMRGKGLLETTSPWLEYWGRPLTSDEVAARLARAAAYIHSGRDCAAGGCA